MAEALFISDLHLSRDAPETLELFLRFVETRARRADVLYILGDLFDVWVGDDDPTPPNGEVIAALRGLGEYGTSIHFLAGNRDFLVGEGFFRSSGCHRLEDPSPIERGGLRALLTHGDILCTDDEEYQRFRALSRTPQWRSSMLARPLEERLRLAEEYRRASRAHKLRAPEQIMDVSRESVEALMREHQVLHLIHGHTHRPGLHHFVLDERPATRIVLPQWEQAGGLLAWGEEGPRTESFPATP